MAMYENFKDTIDGMKERNKKCNLSLSSSTALAHMSHLTILVRPNEICLKKDVMGGRFGMAPLDYVIKRLIQLHAPKSVCSVFDELIVEDINEAMNKVLKSHNLL